MTIVKHTTVTTVMNRKFTEVRDGLVLSGIKRHDSPS
jgi:hypothetical protein